jgi:hypothetical protein
MHSYIQPAGRSLSVRGLVQSISAIPSRRPWWLAAAVLLLAACDGQPSGPARAAGPPPVTAVQQLECSVDVQAGTLSCTSERPAGGASAAIIGGQNSNVVLAADNSVRNGDTVQFNVTVQNLLPEAMGTPDGVMVDTAGISVFFTFGPTVTQGTGTVLLANPDGVAEFTAPGQAYFRYDQMLVQNQVSSAKTWKMVPGPQVQRFAFRVYVAAELQPMLVINEVLVNPAGSTAESAGDWFEVYNAGRFPVQMQGMVIADSAASGRRPYHVISSSLTVASGGYMVLGSTTNTTSNLGVPVDYAWGGALSLVNSLDAVKVARVYGSDTLTIDRTQYAQPSVSAQDGVARELKNPALDNSNMDGSNWDLASVTSVYGAGGRGTPKAQNSTYTP